MPNASHGYSIPYTVRIKIKSVQHYKKCVASLKEHGFKFPSEEVDELTMLRKKSLTRKAYLFLGTGRTCYAFFTMHSVQYCKQMTRKECLKWLISMYPSG